MRTLQLNAAAHKLGDEYYRYLTRTAQSETGADDRCLDLANAYAVALEELRSHLSALPHDTEVDVLLQTTEGHIHLVRGDLERFNTAKSD